jgi:hypothetical protein
MHLSILESGVVGVDGGSLGGVAEWASGGFHLSDRIVGHALKDGTIDWVDSLARSLYFEVVQGGRPGVERLLTVVSVGTIISILLVIQRSTARPPQ